MFEDLDELNKYIYACEKGDKKLSGFICWYLIIQALHNLMVLTGNNSQIWQVLSKGFMAVLLLFSLYYILERIMIQAVIVELVFAMLLLYSFLFAEKCEDFTSIAFNLLFVYLPMGIACYAINDYSIFLKMLYKSSVVVEIITIVCLTISHVSTYEMTSGFLLLIPILLHIDRFIREKKVFDGLMPIIDIAFIILYASRGPILCVGIYIMIYIVFEKSVSKMGKVSFITTIIVFLLVICAGVFSMNDFFIRTFDKYSEASRTIRLIQSGSIGYDASRFSVYEYYLNELNKAPLLSRGLAASWVVSSYPHNIIIELCFAFSIPIGTFLSLILIYYWYIGIRQKDTTLRRLSQIFVASSVSLMWSGTFLTSPTFFVCIALCIKERKKLFRIA